MIERSIAKTCIQGIYLDELPLTTKEKETLIMDDCGIFCELDEE